MVKLISGIDAANPGGVVQFPVLCVSEQSCWETTVYTLLHFRLWNDLWNVSKWDFKPYSVQKPVQPCALWVDITN